MKAPKTLVALVFLLAVAIALCALILPQLSKEPPRLLDIPSGSTTCPNGRITVYVYNNGRGAINESQITGAEITGPNGTIYEPQLEARTISASKSEAVISAYSCGEASGRCPPGAYIIKLSTGGTAATDRVRC